MQNQNNDNFEAIFSYIYTNYQDMTYKIRKLICDIQRKLGYIKNEYNDIYKGIYMNDLFATLSIFSTMLKEINISHHNSQATKDALVEITESLDDIRENLETLINEKIGQDAEFFIMKLFRIFNNHYEEIDKINDLIKIFGNRKKIFFETLNLRQKN